MQEITNTECNVLLHLLPPKDERDGGVLQVVCRGVSFKKSEINTSSKQGRGGLPNCLNWQRPVIPFDFSDNW